VVAVDLTDDGDQVDGHGPIAGSGAGCPRPAQDGLGHAVELADVAEGEAAQEGPQRGTGHHPVAEHGRGEPGAEHVGVVDAVTADHQRVQQGEHLAARPVGTRTVAKVDQLMTAASIPSRSANVAGSSSPALATPWLSSNQLSSWSRVWTDAIEKVPSCFGHGRCRRRHSPTSEGLSRTLHPSCFSTETVDADAGQPRRDRRIRPWLSRSSTQVPFCTPRSSVTTIPTSRRACSKWALIPIRPPIVLSMSPWTSSRTHAGSLARTAGGHGWSAPCRRASKPRRWWSWQPIGVGGSGSSTRGMVASLQCLELPIAIGRSLPAASGPGLVASHTGWTAKTCHSSGTP
jgi:hypothetical protein